MMGNEGSRLSGLEIDDKPIETTDFWTHYQATISDSCRHFSIKSDGSVSVFKGEAALGPLWTVSSPLEKFSNNLLKYRHPCIIKYMSTWQQRSTLHLVTEFVQPLSHVLSSHTPLQICIGLNNVLQALAFLHEQAGMSHNNVSVAAIYVTGEGQWKLGGLQYLCPFAELTSAYLKHARIHRYDKAVDPNEDSYEITTKVDQYSFAVLVEDVFAGWKDDNVPHLHDFKKYCSDHLQHNNPAKRPNLSEVLQHNFFKHEFISIYKFLNFLPLKTNEEKSGFFSHILDNLKCYDEETVAKQLSGLLLSRLTMLDQTARKDVIPYILKPKTQKNSQIDHLGFFSLEVYKEHVKPRLLQLFGVRDSQIRMLLLMHFSKYVHVFTHEELSQHILPELLLGIKDTDDNLVASTLICLSELVPILGADTVIGGKRTKLFTDGRPNSKTSSVSSRNYEEFIPTKQMFEHNENESSLFEKTLRLNERPPPVGGEAIEDGILITESSDIKLVDSEDDWSDWDNTNHHLTTMESSELPQTARDKLDKKDKCDLIMFNSSPIIDEDKPLTKTILLQKAALEAKKNIVDISELDIKNQKCDYLKKGEEFDFFADMTPVIEKPTVVSIAHADGTQDFNSKLNFVPDENEGWGESWND